MQEMQEMGVQSLGWKDPLEQGKTTRSNILTWGIPMDRGAAWATVHTATKSRTWLKRLGTHTGDFYIKIKILSSFSSVLFLWEPSVLCLLCSFSVCWLCLPDRGILRSSSSGAVSGISPFTGKKHRGLYTCALGHTSGTKETLSALPSPKLPGWEELACAQLQGKGRSFTCGTLPKLLMLKTWSLG